MNKDVELLAEAYKKVVLEEHETCSYAKEGCKCSGCPDCKANQEPKHDEDAESMVGNLRKLNSPKAVKAIINTARELLHRYDKHGEIAFMDEVKPFYVQNGKLLSGLLIVKKPKGASGPERSGFFPRIGRTVEITNKVSAGGEPYARLLNMAVNKFLKGGKSEDAEEINDYEAKLDKKEAYKKSLLRQDNDDLDLEEQFFNAMADLKYNKPEVFDMFVKRLDDESFVRMIKNMSGLSM